MPTSVTPASLAPRVRVGRKYSFQLFESNLYNSDPHPYNGVPCPGLHTRVRKLNRARNRQIKIALNRPGSVSFDLPLNSRDAMAIVGYEIKRCIVVFCDGQPVWSGYISALNLVSSTQTLSVNCIGWMQMLYGREMRQQAFFNQLDAGVIAARLLSTANNQIANDNPVEDVLGGMGDFESWNSGLDASDGTSSAPIRSISDAWAASGAKSLKIQQSTLNMTNETMVAPRFAVDPSSTYMVRAMRMINSSHINAKAFFRLRTYTAGGSVTGTYDSPSPTLIYDGREYETKTLFSTSASTAFAQLYIVTVTAASSSSLNVNYDALTMSKTDVKVRPTPIVLGIVDSPAGPVTRTRTYQAGQKIGAALEELSEIESGFDWEVATVSHDATTYIGTGPYGMPVLMREMNVRYTTVKASTTIKGIGSDRPRIVFSINRDTKPRQMVVDDEPIEFNTNAVGSGNLKDLSENRDANSLANRINGRAQNRQAVAQDMDSIDEYGLWEDSVSISDTGIADNVLLAYAGAEVVFRMAPIKSWSPEPFPYNSISGPNAVPKFWDDFKLGDIVYLAAADGALVVGDFISTRGVIFQPIRIFSLTVKVDDNGNEYLTDLNTKAGA